MKRCVITICLSLLLLLPASAQLQYFGYVGGADNDGALDKLKGFTNMAHLSTSADLTSTFVANRVQALTQRGGKAIIDLGFVLWCGTDPATYRTLCPDYVQRWATWKQNNAAILNGSQVLGFTILDEPFRRDANMTQYDAAAHMVRSAFPWAKIILVDAACAIRGQCNGATTLSFSRYTGTLPDVDWLGLDEYAIHPKTDTGYRAAVSQFKARFPGRKWLYVMDGYWDDAHKAAFNIIVPTMGIVAQEWYDVARADADAVLLGVFGWGFLPPFTLSNNFACSVTLQQVAIGRAITGKARPQTALPVGGVDSIDPYGVATGGACDPDGTVCEAPPVDFYIDGNLVATASSPPTDPTDVSYAPQCSTHSAYRFHQRLDPSSASGHVITVKARDLDGGVVTLPINCPSSPSPSCVWYSNFYNAKGYLDNISMGVAIGWVCDPDAPLVSSQVHFVTTYGADLGTFTANASSENDVLGQCGGGSYHRFSVQLPSWAQGTGIVAFATDFTSGEYQIPALCGDGTACTW